MTEKKQQKTKKAAAKKPTRRKKSRAGDFGNEVVQRTVLWEQTVSRKTAIRIDNALKQDEHVIKYGLVDKALLEKVLCLEIKRWKVVVQLTDKIVSKLNDEDLLILVRGNNREDPGSVTYRFRKMCAEFNIDTGYLGVANSRQKKSAYYSVKKYTRTGKKTQTYLINQLASKLSGEYMLRAGTNELARELVSDIIGEVKKIIDARIGDEKED